MTYLLSREIPPIRTRGGWLHGPAIAVFTCRQCGEDVLEDQPLAIRDTSGTFVTLHEACWQSDA